MSQLDRRSVRYPELMERHMKRWIWNGLVLAGGVIVVGCGDHRPDAPAGPVASVTALTAVPACDLSQTSSSVAQYFNSTDAKTARDLIDQIIAAGAGTVAARDRGFDLIALIAQNAQAGTGGSVSDGSDLINKTTACMFRTLAELPETYPEDYTVAITTAAPGGLGVRGGATDPATAPVLSRGSFSGIAPQSGTMWATTLTGNAAPKRVVFYGRPGSTAQTYDWKVLPRNTSFSPRVVVGLCIDNTIETTGLLHEEHVGLLPFTGAYFLDPEFCSSVASRNALSAFTHQVAQLFLPRSLSAAGLTRGIGGSSGGIGSEFGAKKVPNVSLEFTIPPPSTVTVGQAFTVQVRARDPVTNAIVPATELSIIAVNNNGVRKSLLGASPQTTDNVTGIATFSNLRFDANSTGGFRLIVGGGVLGRPAIKVGEVTSIKINVKPAK